MVHAAGWFAQTPAVSWGAVLDGFVPWPPGFARRYRERGYWRGVTLDDALRESFVANADRVAIVDGARRVTYAELGRLCERLALHFAALGIARGAPVVFQLPNVLEFVIAYVACLRVGAIPLTCLPAHRQAEIGYLARFTEAAAWLIPSEFRGFDYGSMADELRPSLPSLRHVFVVGDRTDGDTTRLQRLLDDPIEQRVAPSTLADVRPDPSDVAVFQLSGGTTGLPKIIPRTHDDYLYNSLVFAAATGLDRDGVLLLSVPIAHNFPLACPGVQGALLLGARTILAPSPDAETVLALVERERATWIPAVPATVIGWLNAPRRSAYDLSSIRAICVGGSRLNPEPARAVLAAFGPVLVQVFGMAEGLLCSTRHDDPREVVVETQGRPVSPDDEIRVVDEDGKDVTPGEVGELICRGPYTIRGYYRAVEHNRTAFTDDGFYRTGDMVRLHSSGNLVVEGRRKDLINRGGEKISAEEVENLILSHPAVLNAAVVAMPDPVLGERACAYVIPRPGAQPTLADLTRFLSEDKRIARFKLPERLELRDRLPMTAVGKISKKDLREEIAAMLEKERGRS
jgi:2,3-dihydroxybenzoate-AMP ligase